MSIIVKARELTIPRIGVGLYHGVCFGMWDVGVHPSRYHLPNPDTTTRSSDDKRHVFLRHAHKVIIAWELAKRIQRPKQKEYHRKRYVVIKTYTLSLSPNARLRHDLEDWLDRKFTYEELSTGFES